MPTSPGSSDARVPDHIELPPLGVYIGPIVVRGRGIRWAGSRRTDMASLRISRIV